MFVEEETETILSNNCRVTQKFDKQNNRMDIVCNENKEEHTYNYNLINDCLYPLFCDKNRWEYLNEKIQYNKSDIICLLYTSPSPRDS